MEVGVVRQVDIEQQMQEAYLDYAMSVIVSRALPDVRDGLKPVHRRILFAMYDMGLRPDHPHRKSARIVGEVLGKYHPHSDAAVYDALVRMAQDFSMRGVLINGQGNFGSVDGDPAAAMRYTEAKLTPLANEILVDINKDTVDFVDNFDASLTEPKVLPSRTPNFLLNGASGIAVGMATSVPPHNLGEICDALVFMIEQDIQNKEVTIDELLTFIQGPDFPTGGILHRYSIPKKGEEKSDLIRSAYVMGRGRVSVQAKVHVEEMSRNRNRLVITELPYQTNKATLTEKIASLARDGKIEGLADLRDESDRQGMRLVIELTRTVKPVDILKQLFKMTALQSTFSINMLALVDGEPRLLPIKQSLRLFIKHRYTVITRRSQYELDNAKYRLHVLEGLRIALINLDEVIQTIRSSRTADTAKTNLRKKFKLSEIQASSILNMPLRRLAALERKKIETEYKEVVKQVKYLESLLETPDKLLNIIKEDLIEIKAKYNSPRRTVIIDKVADGNIITAGELLPDEAVVVAVSQKGQICRWPADKGLEPGRGRHKDRLLAAVPARTRDTLYLFTTGGQAIVIPMHQIPEGSSPGEGSALTEFCPNVKGVVVAGVALSASDERYGYLFLVSNGGRVKRISLVDLDAVRGNEATVMKLDNNDTLLTAFISSGQDDIILVTANGQAIRFDENEVRAMGLSAAGVFGIKLGKGDKLVGAGTVVPRGDLITITRKGWGKRTDLEEYPKQGRYGHGVVAMLLNDSTGQVVAADTLNVSDRIMFMAEKGNNKTVYVKSLPKAGRNATGKTVMAASDKNQIERLIALVADGK